MLMISRVKIEFFLLMKKGDVRKQKWKTKPVDLFDNILNLMLENGT